MEHVYNAELLCRVIKVAAKYALYKLCHKLIGIAKGGAVKALTCK
jgi:predicted component of type VI protein secretion system